MLAVAGVTLTDATGTSRATVTAAVPLFPSLVAVIVTGPPAALPVTNPLPSTVAVLELLVAHVTVRPVSVSPLASFVVAANCTVALTAIVAVAGATVTEATGTGMTVMLAVLLFPSLVAVMVIGPPTFCAVTSPFASLVAVIVTVPTPVPVTRPFASTVAMFPFAVDHVTLRPVSGLPFASFGVAVSCAVPPMTMLAVGGETSTVATGTGVTVIDAVPLFPSLVAVMMT